MNRQHAPSSPPAPTHASPPVSPTITQISSRSPTPSAPTVTLAVATSSTNRTIPEFFHPVSDDLAVRKPLKEVEAVEQVKPQPHHPSRPRSSEPQQLKARTSASNMGSRHGKTSDSNERPRAAEDDFSVVHNAHRPSMPPSLSAPAGKLPRLLPTDLSQYTDSTLPTAALTTSSTSLAELAHLIRFEGYQEQRRNHSRVRLHRWLVSSALSTRLLHCGSLAHRTLVDHFRSDDKRSFSSLYNAIHDVRNSCDATRRYALLEPDLELTKNVTTTRKERAGSLTTFMHEIPQKTRDDLLDFLAELRTNPDFLAARICNLTQAELSSLTSFRSAQDAIDSVIASTLKQRGIQPATKSSTSNSPSPVERLLSLQRHDPLSALLFTIFANSSGPDSAEDLRRTDVWANTCAKVILTEKQGGEKFIVSILDAWAAMREWPGKANLELYLMQVLQDGAFLLEKAEAQSVRPRTAGAELPKPSAKDTIAADEFYDRAIKRLFEVIDDEPSAGGIPEGVLEIGTAILKKLDGAKKHRTSTLIFIVSRWFFTTFLLNAIIHPETHGIMIGHHISEHARQKILKEIAIKAQKQVLDLTYNWKQNVPILPEIRTHVENIMARFKTTRPLGSKPVLLPAKAITSPRETVEVQPFLVVCPADFLTLINTLFPDRRPPSSHLDHESTRGGLASSASSISRVSIPFTNRAVSGDASSILSISASSLTSETTGRDPLLDDTTVVPEARTEVDPSASAKIAPTEDYGRRLRLACSEMSRVLGVDGVSGSCHPCAERWAVLYVSPDGKELRTRMRKDNEDEDDTEEESPDSDSEDEGVNDRLDLENDYHQLKESIVKLVEEYEIPKELAPESESKEFSNRTSTLRRGPRTLAGKRTDSAPVLGSKNPYQAQSQLTTMIANQKVAVPGRHRSPQQQRSGSAQSQGDAKEEKPSVLVTMLEAAMHQCQSRSDFVNAHLYFKTLHQLRRLTSSTLTKNGYAPLLNYFSRGPRDSISKASSAIEEFEAWFVWLKQSQERHDSAVEDMMLGLKNLRDKMWYITDVKNSAGYEEARNVAIALKQMGQKTVDGKPVNLHRARTSVKSAANNFLLKTEAQVLDLIAAPTEHGGPNKLADEQADMTSKWLNQYGIESSFCRGEERIHRFCLAIDQCVNKLVGDGILDGPVLWSSELYRRDKEILDSGRQKGDLFLTGVGTLSIAGDEEYEIHSGIRPPSRSLDFAQPKNSPGTGNLASMARRNGSQQSFDSSRWSTTKTMDLMDSQDFFGGSSPVLTIDSKITFWSPFQSLAGQQSASPSSTTNIRPRTASSSNGTVMLNKSATVNDDKRRFLLDLKQTLTGLLLSDLGAMTFSGGSETDAWFSGELGEECIQRREEEERQRKRALAKKKSMKNLKSSKGGNPLETLGRQERGQPAAPVATLQHAAPDIHSGGEHSTSSASDATARSSGTSSAAKRAGLLEFPYNVAFRRLLKKFATHPNPFAKLHALYELELLIVASLSSRSGRYGSRRETLPTVPQSPTLGLVPDLSSREAVVTTNRANNLEEAIANCEERRQQTMAHDPSTAATSTILPPTTSSPLPSVRVSTAGTRSPTNGPPSTDMIVEVLQSLFRDASVRPTTLFRDLQYIAAFVPAQMLDRTARGKAFWDAGLAALVLKQDACRIMVEMADDIVAVHTKKRERLTLGPTNPSSTTTATTNTGSTPEKGTSEKPPKPEEPELSDSLSRFTMADAARMLTITAKEGDAVAERELAILYLTHPELLQKTTLPLSKAGEVFKAAEQMAGRERGGRGGGAGSGGVEGDGGRSDPMTICLSHHWMELSSRGGDALARKYLRAKDEFDGLP